MKILFTLLISLILVYGASGQTCAPKWIYSAPYGIFPDSAHNLPHAVAGTPYNTAIHFRVKKDTSQLIFKIKLRIYIDSIQINSVSGIPAGFSYACNPKSCTFKGDSAGCISLYGTGTKSEAGLHKIVVYVTGYARDSSTNLGFPQADSITYYHLIIDYPAGVTELTQSDVFVSDPLPNPATQNVNLSIYAGHEQSINSRLIDMTGHTVYALTLHDVSGTQNLNIPTDNLPAGIYFVFVQTAEATYKHRIVIAH